MRGNTKRRRASRRASGGDLRRRLRPPRMSRAEIEKRAANIARWWREEQRKMDEPLDPHHSGAIMASLAREAAREWDHGYWRFRDAYDCSLSIVRRRRWDVPQSVWDQLAAWSILDIAGAIRR